MDKQQVIEKLKAMDCEIGEIICNVSVRGNMLENESILVFLCDEPSNDEFIKPNKHWDILDLNDFIEEDNGLGNIMTYTDVREFKTDF